MCEVLQIGEDRVFICGIRKSAPPKCFYCKDGTRSTVLCDYKLADGRTCDIPCCSGHAKHVGTDLDYCLDHQRLVEHTADQALPITRARLSGDGWRHVSDRQCRRCNQALEFWESPSKKLHPLEVRPELNWQLDTHFRYCEFAKEFRKGRTSKAAAPSAQTVSQGELFK